MFDILSTALLTAVIAGLVTSLLVPVTIRVAEVLRALDVPDGRKQQESPVPRLGGVAIMAGVALAAVGMAMSQWGTWGFRGGRAELVALAIGTVLVFLVGVVDDLQGVSAAQKLLVELAAAWLMVRVGWSFTVLGLPFVGNVDLGWFAPFVSMLWIVGVTNAINLIDGLDGLAGGVVAIISASFLVVAVLQGNLLTVLLLGAVVGACVGFLRHNWAPAKIYMGDSGSLTLGFLLAVMSIHSSLKAPAAVAIVVPLLALGLPVLDTLAVMVVRFLERPKSRLAERFLRMFKADRNHLHHLLEAVAPHRQGLVWTFYGLVAGFCALALVVLLTGNLTLGLWLVVGEVAAVWAIRALGLRRAASGVAEEKRGWLRRFRDRQGD
jgi:UDP-GlcNAc:undecaprenyl-phosphate GlcNAc-1-phosphate transferase